MEQYKKPFLFIVGGASTAIEIRETAELYLSGEYDIINVIPENSSINMPYINDDELEPYINNKVENKCKYIVGLTKTILKKKFVLLFEKYNVNPINVIHPSAVIFKTAKVGIGNYIGANSVVSSNTSIGDHNIINFNTTIGHDSTLGSFCSINPGAIISGNVTVGTDTLIGSNSFVFQGKYIGDNCSIDALTYVDRNLDNSVMCTSINGILKVYNKR